MSDFYAGSRYYIDLEKVVLLEYVDKEGEEKISIAMLNGKTYSFYESNDWDDYRDIKEKDLTK